MSIYSVKGEKRVKILDWFSQLHKSVQITLIISIMVIVTIIAVNHTIEENLVNLLLALQALAINSKIPGKSNRSSDPTSKSE